MICFLRFLFMVWQMREWFHWQFHDTYRKIKIRSLSFALDGRSLTITAGKWHPYAA
jgi:hypothetical protein